jgi:hypothetical protein
MLGLFPAPRRCNRRQWLGMSTLAGLAGGLWPRLALAEDAAAAGDARRPATAKNCINIFLCGGPSQPDLWDLKPTAPSGIRTLFEPIQTNVPGILFGSPIPKVARHADKLAIIRSLTHDDNGHETAIIRTLLGQLPPRAGELFVSRGDHPGLGGILHKLLGPAGDLPPWVVLPRYFGTYSPPYKGQSAGFLGAAYDPLMFDKERKGSLSDAPLTLDAIRLLDGVDAQRLAARRSLRSHVGSMAEDRLANSLLSGYYEKAFHLLESAAVREVFNLQREPAAVRERYGRNEYGQSFLMARRLVENGVRMVNIFWTFFDAKGCQFNLWDCHGVADDVCGVDGQRKGTEQLTHKYCTPSFDQSFSALLEDLDQRGLLDETLVVVAGEFGRTPRINPTAGRDHWAHCYTQLLAGGGVRGGQVYGASDPHGAYVKDLPVTPDDFAATILHAFGLSPEAAIHDALHRPVRITTGQPVTAVF